MKKILFLGLLLTLILTTVASAELLITANPIGQGRWGVLGSYRNDANVSNSSSMSMGSLGAYLAYGINDKMDLYASYGSGTVSGLPLGVTGISGSSYGLTLKYAAIAESSTMPVSVALGAGYKMVSQKVDTVLGSSTDNGGQMLIGVGVSKIMVPFIPYAGLLYRNTNFTTTAAASNSSQIDLTLGSAIAWSMQGAVYVEYTLQSITPSGGSAYSSGQYALGVGYKI